MGPLIQKLTGIFAAAAGTCDKATNSFFGLPKWYEYLPYQWDDVTKRCEVTIQLDLHNHPAELWLVGLAVIDMLLHIAGLVAIGFVIYGGFQYVTSQGEPESTKHALSTIINALIGVVLAIAAVTIVSFVGRKLG